MFFSRLNMKSYKFEILTFQSKVIEIKRNKTDAENVDQVVVLSHLMVRVKRQVGKYQTSTT
jgi:spore coat protein CotF